MQPVACISKLFDADLNKQEPGNDAINIKTNLNIKLDSPFFSHWSLKKLLFYLLFFLNKHF